MAKSVIVGNVLPLVLFLAVLVLCGKRVESQINPGLQLCVSQRGLDYAGEVAVDLLYAEAQKIQIPDQSGSTKIFIGTVNYEVKNIKVTNVVKPSSKVVASPGSITWALSNTGISVEGNWAYNYKKWFIRIRDSGTFTGSVSGASISLSVSLGLDATGHPTISSTGCTCTISSVKIKLRGGASWLYNLFTGFVEKPIRNTLQTKICEAATKVINANANNLLMSFPLQKTVNSDWLLDYRFLTAPEIQTGNLCTKHKAAFYYKDDTNEPPFQAAPFPTTTTSNQMLSIWVSDYVANTIGYAIFRQNLLRYTLTYRDLPGDFKSCVNTTCPAEACCLGNIFPELSNKYPNASVEVEMAVSKAPTANISNSALQVTFSGAMSFQIRLSNGSVVEVLKINVKMDVFVTVTLNAAVLRGAVTRLVPTIDVVSSTIGSISSDLLSKAVQLLGNAFLIPKLNEKGQEGIPIPAIRDVNFINIDLKMQNHYLLVTTDVQRSQ